MRRDGVYAKALGSAWEEIIDRSSIISDSYLGCLSKTALLFLLLKIYF